MAFNDTEHLKVREAIREAIQRDIADQRVAIIKLFGVGTIPQTESEIEGYYHGRAELIRQGEPTWVARNFDVDSTGMTFDFFAPDKNGLRVLMTEDFQDWEGYVGREGEIGSGLTSLCTAVKFVEEFEL